MSRKHEVTFSVPHGMRAGDRLQGYCDHPRRWWRLWCGLFVVVAATRTTLSTRPYHLIDWCSDVLRSAANAMRPRPE